ncbi:ABC transporter ATP-binding protein [Rubripirellula amarantea]|nr:ABC transporter ATP-binding protein [Rubripirellula amarantea]
MNADTSMTVIKLDQISKRYGSKEALSQATLEVPAGTVFAVLGENGAGKTTMIRILTGYLKPDSGTATVLGMNCEQQSLDIRRRIGYVSDSPALYEWMKPEEIGWFTSAFYGPGFPEAYLSLLAEFDVPTGIKIKSLSKGQRAKVALALATAHDPELLILDEPTSGLDPMVRRHFLESMVKRAASGRTVLLSSHQISEVERVADWVAIVHAGKVKIVQRLEDLRSSTCIVTATLDHSDAAYPLPPGNVLTEASNARQIRWVVMNLDDQAMDGFRNQPCFAHVVVTSPTLEDIFVAVCDHRATRPRSYHDESRTQEVAS